MTEWYEVNRPTRAIDPSDRGFQYGDGLFETIAIRDGKPRQWVGFSKSLAREIGSRNITVNVVAPGFINTNMTKNLPNKNRAAMLGQVPLGRLGASSDIANAVLFLASEGGAYITDKTLHVNGGMVMT